MTDAETLREIDSLWSLSRQVKLTRILYIPHSATWATAVSHSRFSTPADENWNRGTCWKRFAYWLKSTRQTP